MIQALRNAFALDAASVCIIETSSSLIEAYDCYDCIPTARRSYLKTLTAEPVHFILHNPTNTNLAFAALDNCLLKENDIARCDFILGNFQKLYFVEIKQVNKGKRKNARADAAQQLHSAISLLKSLVNLEETNILAVICLGAKQVYPLRNATSAAQAFAFKSTLNATLLEGQSHIY